MIAGLPVGGNSQLVGLLTPSQDLRRHPAMTDTSADVEPTVGRQRGSIGEDGDLVDDDA